MKYIIILAIVFISLPGVAQKYFTKEAHLTFISEAPLETIEGNNNKGMSVLDLDNGNIEFAVLIKAFHFEKALMQVHFNENYMESEKYPKALFKGSFDNFNMPDEDTTQTLTAKGDLTIHGETHPFETTVEMSLHGGKIHGIGHFEVELSAFKINIPVVVKENISKYVQVHVEASYELLNN